MINKTSYEFSFKNLKVGSAQNLKKEKTKNKNKKHYCVKVVNICMSFNDLLCLVLASSLLLFLLEKNVIRIIDDFAIIYIGRRKIDM